MSLFSPFLKSRRDFESTVSSVRNERSIYVSKYRTNVTVSMEHANGMFTLVNIEHKLVEPIRVAIFLSAENKSIADLNLGK